MAFIELNNLIKFEDFNLKNEKLYIENPLNSEVLLFLII